MKTLPASKPKNSIKPGDIFKLGDHHLLCGDSIDQKLVQRLLADEKVKLILTDPPFGVNYVGSKLPSQKIDHLAIANDQIQSEKEYQAFSEAWLTAVGPKLHDKNAYYIFNSDRMLFSLKDALDSQDFKFSQLLIWVKTGAVIGRLDYCPQHELIVYGWHGRHEIPSYKDKSILIAPKPKKNALHPTMKPISLLRRLVLNSTKIGEIVYDPFLGSGSTLLACEQTKRRCFGIELEPKYCEATITRFEKITGIKAVKVTPPL